MPISEMPPTAESSRAGLYWSSGIRQPAAHRLPSGARYRQVISPLVGSRDCHPERPVVPAGMFGRVMLVPTDHAGSGDWLGVSQMVGRRLHRKPSRRILERDSPVEREISRSSSTWVMTWVLWKYGSFGKMDQQNLQNEKAVVRTAWHGGQKDNTMKRSTLGVRKAGVRPAVEG